MRGHHRLITSTRQQNKIDEAASKRAAAKLRMADNGGPTRYEQTCLGKVALTRQGARVEMRRQRGKGLRSYRCRHCDMYHLTKAKEHW